MRIAIFPGYDETAASSRIRAFTLLRSLRALGHDARLRDAAGADVVYVQKRISRAQLSALERGISAGTRLVYDVDDAGNPLWHAIAPSVLRRVILRADVVTTDTEGHRELLVRDYSARAVEIVSDPIDYDPAAPVRNPIDDDGPLRILWFGNVWNIALFRKYLGALQSIPGAEILAVTNTGAIASLSAQLPGVKLLPWSRDTFVDILRGCTLTVLPHDGSEIDRAKSNNRMITSITWGVPAVVSRTPEYERTAIEGGVEWAVFSDERDLVAAVERLRGAAARRAYLDSAQPEIWRRYSPAAVAERFIEIVSAARRPDAAAPGYLRWVWRASRRRVASALAFEAGHLLLRR